MDAFKKKKKINLLFKKKKYQKQIKELSDLNNFQTLLVLELDIIFFQT